MYCDVGGSSGGMGCELRGGVRTEQGGKLHGDNRQGKKSGVVVTRPSCSYKHIQDLRGW